MKKLLLALMLLLPINTYADFIHPMDFNGSEEQKNRVVEIIKARVKKDYCQSGINMCQDTTLRMMEQQNLNAFKAATKAKNRKIMDRAIKDYCLSGIDMCNYTTILMMYKQNVDASKKNLKW